MENLERNSLNYILATRTNAGRAWGTTGVSFLERR